MIVRRLIALSVLFLLSWPYLLAQDDYYRRKAENYTKEAEYYHEKAAQYLNWAADALSKH